MHYFSFYSLFPPGEPCKYSTVTSLLGSPAQNCLQRISFHPFFVVSLLYNGFSCFNLSEVRGIRFGSESMHQFSMESSCQEF